MKQHDQNRNRSHFNFKTTWMKIRVFRILHRSCEYGPNLACFTFLEATLILLSSTVVYFVIKPRDFCTLLDCFIYKLARKHKLERRKLLNSKPFYHKQSSIKTSKICQVIGSTNSYTISGTNTQTFIPEVL